MTDRPLVSIVLPSLNVVNYIGECLESVVSQSLKEIEIICVDAGSTDGTLEIISAYMAKDSRIRLITSDRKSYGLQMNLGLDAAHGKYLAIVETDDMIPENMLKDLYEIAQKKKLDFLKADFYRFVSSKDGSLDKTYIPLTKNKALYNVIVEPANRWETFKFVMNTWSGIYSIDFLRRWNIRHNETAGASYQDNGFWFQTFMRAKRAYFIDKPYYLNRRDNPNSSVFSTSKLWCMRDEYDNLRSIIDSDSDNCARFIPLCNYFRFCGYYYNTLARVSHELRKEFLTYFSEEYRRLFNNGEIERELFAAKEWDVLQNIVWDPDNFSLQNIKNGQFARPIAEECVEKGPIASIIVPVYNTEKYVADCLDSLLRQSESNIEIICINDGSKDGSLKILEDYAKRDSRVKVYSQVNSGPSAARNHGLRRANGKYIFFVDSDDGLALNAVRTICNLAECKKSDVVIYGFDTKHYPLYGEPPRWLKTKNPNRDFVYPAFEPNALFVEKGAFPLAARNCFRKNFLDSINASFAEEIKFGEDTVFQFQVFPQAKNITFTRFIGYYYRCSRPGSLMAVDNATRFNKVKDHLAVVTYLMYWLSENKILESMRHSFITWGVNFILGEYFELEESEQYKLGQDVLNVVGLLTNNEFSRWLGSGNNARLQTIRNIVG